MNTRKWLVPALGLLLAGPAVAADYGPSRAADDGTRVETQREGKAPPASRRARRLAREYAQNPADVQALRDRGMGWGEIRQALHISQRSGKPVNEIVELRDSGMGWGEISSRYNVPGARDEEKTGSAAVERERALKERRGRFGSDTQNQGREGRDIDRDAAPPPSQSIPDGPVPEPSVLPEETAPAPTEAQPDAGAPLIP